MSEAYTNSHLLRENTISDIGYTLCDMQTEDAGSVWELFMPQYVAEIPERLRGSYMGYMYECGLTGTVHTRRTTLPFTDVRVYWVLAATDDIPPSVRDANKGNTWKIQTVVTPRG